MPSAPHVEQPNRRYKRYYERFRLPEQNEIPCEGVNVSLQGYVSVIGLGGLFVRTNEACEFGKRMTIRIHCEEGPVVAKVAVRYAAPGGLGLEFVELRGEFEDNLRKALLRFARLGFKD